MKTEKNRKLHGSVLLTVVAVMAMLIIFMTGTLVLANAANRRSHRSYTSSQAEYTARAAIDAFYRSTQDNTTIRDAVLNLGTSVTYADVDFGAAYNTAMGRLVDPDGSGTHDGQIRIEQLHDAAGHPITQWKWNPSPEDPSHPGRALPAQWEEFNVIRVTATVQVGQRGARKTIYQDFLANPTTFTPPGGPPSPSAPEGFQTIGNSAFNTTGSTLSTPVILGLGEYNRDSVYDPRNSTEIYSPMFFVNGSFETSAQFHIHVSDPSFKTIITKDLNVNNELIVDVEYDPGLLPADWTQKDVPYFFVNGTLNYNQNQLYLGTGYSGDGVTGNQAPYNVFLGKANIDCTGPVHIAGDLYLMDAGADNLINGGSSSKLYSWTASMDPASGSQFTPAKTGSIYCNGNLEYNAGGEIDGELRVEGTLTINANEPLTIHGNVVARNIVLNGTKSVEIVDGSGAFYDSLSGDNDTAKANFQSVQMGDYAAFLEPAYPDTMTREEIYGQDPTASDLQSMFSGFVQPGGNKIITNQTELLVAIGYDNTRGDFSNYFTELPSTVPAKNTSNTYGDGYTNGTSSVVYIPHDASLSGTVTIEPPAGATEFWVVLGDERETFTIPSDTRLVLDDSSCVINVMIQGDLKLDDRSALLCKSVADKITGQTSLGDIDQNTDHVNVMLYSNETTTLTLGAQALVAANALAPNMELIGGTTSQWTVNSYTSKYGVEPNWLGSGHQVTWLGNGLFKGVPDAINNFGFLKLDTGF